MTAQGLRWASLAVVLTAAGGGAGCAVVGKRLVAPAGYAVGPPPVALGAEAVSVPTGAGDALAGWFISAPPEAPGVALLHGIHDDRRDLVARAHLFREAGFAVLLVDLQGHGESPGDRITYGWRERRDAVAAVSYLRRRRPGAPVGLVGISLGGAAAALAGESLGADVVVLEAAFPTIEAAMRNRLRVWLGPLGPLLLPALMRQVQAQIGVPADSLRPVETVRHLAAPVLVVGGSRDRYTPPAETRALFAAAAAPKALWIVEGAGHEDFLEADAEGYRHHVLGFLLTHLDAAVPHME